MKYLIAKIGLRAVAMVISVSLTASVLVVLALIGRVFDAA